ncbi:MAG: hypothetical protein ACXIUQ_15415 [Cecembia sp.]
MLIRIYRSWMRRIIVYLLLVNFINLSANFYHSSVIDSSLLVNHDPIDSLAELVLEFILDMDEETIPDTEIPHEKKKFSDIKLHFEAKALSIATSYQITTAKHSDFYFKFFQSIKGDVNAPPPKSV